MNAIEEDWKNNFLKKIEMKWNKGRKTAHPSFYYRKSSINPPGLLILNTFEGAGGGGGLLETGDIFERGAYLI